MYTSTQAFVDEMESRELKYDYKGVSESGDEVLIIRFNGENLPKIQVMFFFAENCQNVAVRCFDFVKIPENKVAKMMAVVNEQNNVYRYAKFCIDTSDNTIQMEMDAVFRGHDVGTICYELLMRCVNICDEAYPDFMKALWS